MSDTTEMVISMSPEGRAFLSDLARRAGLPEGEVIRLALAMFRAAVDARDRGRYVGVASSLSMLEAEFTWDGTLPKKDG